MDTAQPVRLLIVIDDIAQGIHRRREDLIFMVYQAEIPFQLVCVWVEDTDLTASDFSFQKPDGDYSQTVIIKNRVSDGIRTGGFPGNMDIQIMPFDKLVK